MRVVRTVVSLAALLCALAQPAASQVLFWLDTSYGAPTVNRADADGNSLGSVALAAGSLPEGLALDAGGRIYWGEASWFSAKVNRAAPTLAGITPIVTGGSCYRGVAVDGVAKRVYWTSSKLISGATVGRSALDGSGAITLIPLAAGSNPRGIAVDQPAGKIYWADFDLDVLYQANLDGTGMVAWQNLPPGSAPYGVAVDSPGQRVYWTEYGSGSLKSANTDGTGLTTILSGQGNPTYIALDPVNARMYWSDGQPGFQGIRRATTSGAGVVTLPCPLSTYGGLAYQTDGLLPVPREPLPTEFALHPVRPNPGRGPVQLRFSLPRESHVRLSVLDLQGRELDVLADGVMPAGTMERSWSSRSGANAGVYFVRMAVAGRTWVQRFALIP